jgi:signal transduction histidine kinase
MFFICVGIDIFSQNYWALIPTSFLCISIAFSRALPWLAISLSAVGLGFTIIFGLAPQPSGFGALLTLLIISAFASVIQRRVGFGLVLALTALQIGWYIQNLDSSQNFYGVQLPTAESKLIVTVLGLLVVVSAGINSWMLGRWLYTRITHVGTDIDVSLLEAQLEQAQYSVAEQDRKLGIARDVADLLLDNVSSTLVTAESGSYSAKSDPTVATRILDTVIVGLKNSFAEIRRMSDLLGLGETDSIAMPGLRDLNSLFVDFRDFGYIVNFRENGEPLKLSNGAELVIYRVLSESLQNIKQHTPVGTGVDVDFMWQGTAFQLLIKDNGEEMRRVLASETNGYDVSADQKALTERISGPGLSAMQQRVALYEGIVEVSRVPGVGFTVAASFPNIAQYARGN